MSISDASAAASSLCDTAPAAVAERAHAQPFDDAVLLKRYAASGDREALGELFRRYEPAAYRVALRFTGNSADAEEAVQGAFLQLISTSAQFRGEGSVQGWILRIVINECKIRMRQDLSRRRREDTRKSDVYQSAQPDLVKQELAAFARRAVEALPQHYRQPVWMYYIKGLGPREIAAVLSLKEDTVRKRITRGIDQVRSALHV